MTLSTALPLPNGTSLPNRIAKAATSEGLAHRRTGAPTEKLTRLYERWGRGGAGLLITGNVVVDADGRTEPGNVIVEDDRHLAQLSRWAEAAQANGSQLWMQINHAGRQSPRRITSQPVAPSVIGMKGFAGMFAKPRELSDDEIHVLVRRYAIAAGVAKAAGFSGVQIHAAHGYLVSQFLSPHTNRRTDDWGGDAERRMRFLVEIVRAMRTTVGPKFPIGVKLNSADFQRGGFTEQESMRVVQVLEAEGVDLLEISGGSYEKSVMMGARESTVRREAYFLEYATKVRKITKLPLLLTGGMRTAQTMRDVVSSGAVDMVGLARPLIVEPDLPRQILAGDSDGAVTVATKVGIRMFDDMLQISWYQQQLHRMANGAEPDAKLGRWSSLAVGFFKSFAFNPLTFLVPKRRSKKLTAATAR